MRHFFLYILMTFLLISCNKFGIEIEIQNNHEKIIDSLIVSNGFNASKHIELKPHEKASTFLDFKENNTHNDGNYFIKYYIGTKLFTKNFGYYSNGFPSTHKMEIKIEKDTLLVNEIFE